MENIVFTVREIANSDKNQIKPPEWLKDLGTDISTKRHNIRAALNSPVTEYQSIMNLVKECVFKNKQHVSPYEARLAFLYTALPDIFPTLSSHPVFSSNTTLLGIIWKKCQQQPLSEAEEDDYDEFAGIPLEGISWKKNIFRFSLCVFAITIAAFTAALAVGIVAAVTLFHAAKSLYYNNAPFSLAALLISIGSGLFWAYGTSDHDFLYNKDFLTPNHLNELYSILFGAFIYFIFQLFIFTPYAFKKALVQFQREKSIPNEETYKDQPLAFECALEIIDILNIAISKAYSRWGFIPEIIQVLSYMTHDIAHKHGRTLIMSNDSQPLDESEVDSDNRYLLQQELRLQDDDDKEAVTIIKESKKDPIGPNDDIQYEKVSAVYFRPPTIMTQSTDSAPEAKV